MVKGNPDRKPAIGGNSAVGTRWRIAFAIGVSVAIIASTIFIILQINEVSDTKNLRVPYFLSINNPSKPNETMFLNMELDSADGFMAAQRDITVNVGLFPNHRLRGEGGFGYSDLPNDYALIFEGTSCPGDSKKFSIIGSTADACVVELTKEPVKAIAQNPKGVNFVGTDKIKFSTGGQFGVLLAANFNETVGTLDTMPSESKFINIAPFETARELELSEKTLYMAIPLAIIGASISLIPLFLRKDSG